MTTLLEPRLISRIPNSTDTLECSVHTLPKPLMREFRHVFGDKYTINNNDDDDDDDNNMADNNDDDTSGLELLALPTNQQARQDLVAVGDHVELEKDRLLNVFMEFGKDVCEKIRSYGYWADFIDPCSGLPMLTKDCNKVYSEVDGMECLLHYKAHNAGFCKILTHPKWGSAVYPATIFTYAPRNFILQLITDQYPQAVSTN